MANSDNYVPLVYGKQNNKSPSYGYPAPVNLGPGALPAFPANTYPINRDTEPVNSLLYSLSNILSPIHSTKPISPLQALADSIPQVPFREKTGYEWGMPSYIPVDTPDSYGNITDEDKTVTVDSTGISGSGSTSEEPVKPIKTPKKKGLQKLTSDISTTSSEQPKVANITEAPIPTSAPTNTVTQPDNVPVDNPAIDESYYRYLRNNGWNDFDARRQAIRYY